MGTRLIVTRHGSQSRRFTHLRSFIKIVTWIHFITVSLRVGSKAYIIFTTSLSLSVCLSRFLCFCCFELKPIVILVSVFISLIYMEKPLLSGESSRATAAGRKREHQNRSEAIAYGSNFEKAAALVDLVRFILCFTFLMCPIIHLLSLLRKCLFFGVR